MCALADVTVVLPLPLESFQSEFLLVQVYVRKRPHLDAFLEAVSELFEVVVFTASQQVYAERLLNMIDPQKKFVKWVIAPALVLVVGCRGGGGGGGGLGPIVMVILLEEQRKTVAESRAHWGKCYVLVSHNMRKRNRI